MAIETFSARLVRRERLTDNVDQLIFERVDGQVFEFIPGQFVTFLFEDAQGAVKRRSYSIATDGRPGLEIAISYVPNGFASEKLRAAQLGDEFQMMGPVGRLVLQSEPGRRLILVGTGTGIAPYRAMLQQLTGLLQADSALEVMILQGVARASEVLYREDFESFASQHPRAGYVSCLSRETQVASVHEHAGRVQRYLATMTLMPGKDVIYLCGNPNMVDETFSALTALGFPSKDVRREKYISS